MTETRLEKEWRAWKQRRRWWWPFPREGWGKARLLLEQRRRDELSP